MLLPLFSFVALVRLVAAAGTISHVPRQSANLICGPIPYDGLLHLAPLPPNNFPEVALDIVNGELQQVDGSQSMFSLLPCTTKFMNLTTISGYNYVEYYG
jgi:hypothetical protein